MKYVLSVDQSTQGTKALLFSESGALLTRADMPHRQYIDERGWVSHDPNEIWQNLKRAVSILLEEASVDPADIACIGVSNQRETSLIWNKETGEPLGLAIVWQCSRAAAVCAEIEKTGVGKLIYERTGIPLSPFFPASKFSWMLRHVPGAQALAQAHRLCFGTIDTWLVWRMTKGAAYKTDYANASRTQLFNIHTRKWDAEICRVFGVDPGDLAAVCDSNARYGETDLDGLLPQAVPITGVIGDSQGALFGHGGLQSGSIKATYGTGTSVMMNIGASPILSSHGLVTSLGWGINGSVTYVIEGNINYSGAVVTWLKDIGLIQAFSDTAEMAQAANAKDQTVLVPAFSGLGAPYWCNTANAILYGMRRTTGRNELVKAALESIAYQIAAVIDSIHADTGLQVRKMLVDGGAAKNRYLMQFQADLIAADILVPDTEELSGIGAAYLAGLSIGLYDEKVFQANRRTAYHPAMTDEQRAEKRDAWERAVSIVLGKDGDFRV